MESSLTRPSGHAQQGVTVLELAVVVSLLVILAGAATISFRGYMDERGLANWADSLAKDVRAAQQLGIARRAAVQVAFSARGGGSPASYAVTVGGSAVRAQSLPLGFDLIPLPPAAILPTFQFNSLGVPPGGAGVRLTDDAGRTRTVTVAPLTGAVTVSDP